MKPIDTKAHAVVDYIIGLLLLFMPYMLSLDTPEAENNVLYFTGTAVLIYSLITDYDLGLLELIPLPLHFALDMLTGIILGGSPWLFGFSEKIWLPYVTLGAVMLLLPLLTRAKKQDSSLIG
jgi:uncharacterized membrane protein